MELLRARDVMDRLGITYRQLNKLVASGLIKPIRKRGCRLWYRARDIATL
ncbi:MAG: type IV toxin-antitoxin system AbiEi family antitoxin domain-containing protein [Verrucomicrobia bacterium]|nr:type IV toxin-antitoxin system AbiEi family antitoxin domain-containing protein [Verrucomicrobiota bacterium]